MTMSVTTQTRTNAGLAGALRIQVMRLARRLRQMRSTDALSATQLAVLGTLTREGELSMGQLAAHERVTPPSMTRTVASLVTAGLVERRADDADRRHQRVRITEDGSAIVRADRQRRQMWLSQRVAELTSEEREVLRRALPVLERISAS